VRAVVAFLLGALALGGCGRDAVGAEEAWPELETAVQRSAESGEPLEPVESVGDRRWDRLYVFGPYTPRTEIERRIGFEWKGATAIESQDAVQLLLLVDGKRVARAVDLPRGRADFGCLEGAPVKRKDKLRVSREPGKVAVVTTAGRACRTPGRP